MNSKYTKEDFESYISKLGMSYNSFSESDLKYINAGDYEFGMGLASYKSLYSKAKTADEKKKYHQGAEELRSGRYGYSAGTDGTYYIPNGNKFSYEEAPAFSYEANSDPVYKAYQKQYAREGQRAAENALGNASANTGGIASSYAVTAAAQQGNYYGSQMSDKIPELYDMAYNRYKNELDQYNTDRDFSYKQHYDELEQGNVDREFDYNMSKGEYNQKLADAEMKAKYGDYSGLKALGIDVSGYMTDNEWNLLFQQAKMAMEAGDASGAYKILGMKSSNTKFAQDYKVAELALKSGNYGPLYNLMRKYYVG